MTGTRPGRASRRWSWMRPSRAWSSATSCGPRSLDGDTPEGFDPAVATIAFRLAPEQIDRAARAARRAAIAAGRAMTVDDVSGGARAQNAAGLERLARRIVPSRRLGRPRPAAGRGAAAAGAGRPRPPPRARGRASGGWAPRAPAACGITALFCGRLGHGQDDVGGGPRRRPRPRPLRHRPLDGRRQVHRRDGEEPRPHLHGGRPGQRGPPVRRGGRPLRQAVRGEGRPRPLRERRGRLPAPADGALRRPGDPDDEPARERGRGLRPPARRHRRLPDARGGATGSGSGRRNLRPELPRGRRHRPRRSWRAGSSSRAATSATSA